MYENSGSTSRTVGIQKLFIVICYLELMLGFTLFSLLTFMHVVLLVGHRLPTSTSVLLVGIFYIFSSFIVCILAVFQIRSVRRRKLCILRICLSLTLILILAESWIYFDHFAHSRPYTPGSTTMLYLIIVKIIVLICGCVFYKQLSVSMETNNGQYWPVQGSTHYYNNRLYDIDEHHEHDCSNYECDDECDNVVEYDDDDDE